MNYLSSIFVGFILISLPGFVFSQNDVDKQNILVVRINPMGTFVGAIPLSAEIFAQPKLSVTLNGMYQHANSGSGNSIYTHSGYAIGPELRYYFVNAIKKDVTSKVYVAGFYTYEEYRNLTLDRNLNEVPCYIHGLGSGITFGSQWFFYNHLVIDFYVGPAFMSFSKDEPYDENLSKGGFFVSMAGPKSNGTRVKLGFSIGIAF